MKNANAMAQAKTPRILVLVTNYPGGDSEEAHRFVHVRNLYYQEQGISITVLSFATERDYTYEGIRVISLASYIHSPTEYDVLITHQANIRQHYRFMKKYGSRFPRFIFFFHGHEVLRFKTVYPRPYGYVKKSTIKMLIRDVYDQFKLLVWKKYIPKVISKSEIVFVSQWMRDEFLKATGLSLTDLKNKYSITYNCVGKLFQEQEYNAFTEKEYDLITIRSNLDGSKYCIDVVCRMAEDNPGLSFLVIGRGHYFEHFEKPDNLTWMNQTMDHTQIIEILQKARCALMPTRTDSQGLMMCEMATFGMPVVTSDIPVCHEALDIFPNVAMVDNSEKVTDLDAIIKKLEMDLPYPKVDAYFNSKTSAHEVEIIYQVARGIEK